MELVSVIRHCRHMSVEETLAHWRCGSEAAAPVARRSIDNNATSLPAEAADGKLDNEHHPYQTLAE
jgi:hypothetical protein